MTDINHYFAKDKKYFSKTKFSSPRIPFSKKTASSANHLELSELEIHSSKNDSKGKMFLAFRGCSSLDMASFETHVLRCRDLISLWSD